ncbi:hypothetical protein [Flammeovirga kamogawensis]|uniref:YubB ferredoxin-like domain-containing protein n=1 Tax=Flammeovirga kamogawensis TaxID=373891 RepID=A0ABX8H343_9BACT|nr:hypothetical protein [Flammeovirga kamogawensis]MBB6463608.1 hypothetical protein [Flammeovirga kamogawensis]QWG09831.1 hypothetical protein KM029_19315 [Flammeovirga kamogawensis]TRX65339.1 hypothetical protein EO216_22715 [Flammeovirga kamogawensis]
MMTILYKLNNTEKIQDSIFDSLIESKLFIELISIKLIDFNNGEIINIFQGLRDLKNFVGNNKIITYNDSIAINVSEFIDMSIRRTCTLEIAISIDKIKHEIFIDYDTFFFNIYKSLPNGLGYVSWVDVGNYYKFDSKYGLDKFEFYDSVFNEKPLFYHCVTTEEVYEEDHTKEQLLNCPFIKVEEWEGGSIEMLHYNNPLEIESEENIEQIRKVRKYLSENNLYS